MSFIRRDVRDIRLMQPLPGSTNLPEVPARLLETKSIRKLFHGIDPVDHRPYLRMFERCHVFALLPPIANDQPLQPSLLCHQESSWRLSTVPRQNPDERDVPTHPNRPNGLLQCARATRFQHVVDAPSLRELHYLFAPCWIRAVVNPVVGPEFQRPVQLLIG